MDAGVDRKDDIVASLIDACVDEFYNSRFKSGNAFLSAAKNQFKVLEYVNRNYIAQQSIIDIQYVVMVSRPSNRIIYLISSTIRAMEKKENLPVGLHQSILQTSL